MQNLQNSADFISTTLIKVAQWYQGLQNLTVAGEMILCQATEIYKDLKSGITTNVPKFITGLKY